MFKTILNTNLILFVICIFSSSLVADEEKFTSFDGNYILKTGMMEETKDRFVENSVYGKLSIQDNAFEIKEEPYTASCRIFQNQTIGNINYQKFIVFCDYQIDADWVESYRKKNSLIYCDQKGWFDDRRCVERNPITQTESIWDLVIVNDSLFMRKFQNFNSGVRRIGRELWCDRTFISTLTSADPKTDDYFALPCSVLDVNQLVFKLDDSYMSKIAHIFSSPSETACSYRAEEECFLLEDSFGEWDDINQMLIDFDPYIKRNLSLSIPSSNFLVIGDDIYLNDGSDGAQVGSILGLLGGAVCEIYLQIPGCTEAGAGIGEISGRKLTYEDGTILDQQFCIGYLYAPSMNNSDDADWKYLCEGFSHPAVSDYSSYIPTSFSEPYIAYYMVEYEID